MKHVDVVRDVYKRQGSSHIKDDVDTQDQRVDGSSDSGGNVQSHHAHGGHQKDGAGACYAGGSRAGHGHGEYQQNHLRDGELDTGCKCDGEHGDYLVICLAVQIDLGTQRQREAGDASGNAHFLLRRADGDGKSGSAAPCGECHQHDLLRLLKEGERIELCLLYTSRCV